MPFVVMMSPDNVMAILLLVLFMLTRHSTGLLSLSVLAHHLSLAVCVVTVYSAPERLLMSECWKPQKTSGPVRCNDFTQNHSAVGDGGGGGLVAAYVVDGRCSSLVVCHRAGLCKFYP